MNKLSLNRKFKHGFAVSCLLILGACAIDAQNTCPPGQMPSGRSGQCQSRAQQPKPGGAQSEIDQNSESTRPNGSSAPNATNEINAQPAPPSPNPNVLEQLKQDAESKRQGNSPAPQRTPQPTPTPTEAEEQNENNLLYMNKAPINPYDDIPALRDLYKQVNSSSEVKRFGEEIFANGPGTSISNLGNSTSGDTTGTSTTVVYPNPVASSDASSGGLLDANSASPANLAPNGSPSPNGGNLANGNIPPNGGMNATTSPYSGAASALIPGAYSTTYMGPGNSSNLPMDLPVGPDYVVGSGDGVTVDVWGSVSFHLERVVDLQGQITLPEVGSMPAAGMTLGRLQQAIEAQLKTRYRNLQASVSLSKLRSIRIYVVGDVLHPGAYDVNSMSTVLNALYAAGGPTSVGSLRVARHFRGRQLVQDVDLYDLILHGVRGDMQRLQAGDTVLVPPVGTEVTVKGMVHRPAIYELRGERSLAEVLAIAGGVLPTGTLRHVEVERIEAHQNRTMLSLDLPETTDYSAADRLVQEFQVQDKDIVRIFPILPYSEKTVFLVGHVVRPGKYSYRDGMKLADLIKSSSDLLPEPAHYGEIIRLSPPEYRPEVISFTVSDVSKNLGNISLAPFDTVRLHSRYEYEDSPRVAVYGEVRSPGTHGLNGDSRVRDAIFAAGGLTPDALQEQAQVYRRQSDSTTKVFTIELGKALAGDADSNIKLANADTIVVHANTAKVDPFKVYIQGQIANPGFYPFSPGMTASDLVKMAGGFTYGAYKESADLSRFEVKNGAVRSTPQLTIAIGKAVGGDKSEDIQLQNGDVLSVRQITGWEDIGASVTVKGEVAHAGGFGIQNGERLSSVLKRAGGFRQGAYAEGIVLERDAVRQVAEKTRAELIDRIEAQQFSVSEASTNTNGSSTTNLQQMQLQRQEILERLKRQTASGRIAVRIGNDINRWQNTPADIELRAGDTIVVPKLLSFVVVTGEVYGSSAVSFNPGAKVSWYIERAGGMTDMANKKNVFVIRADGTVIGRKTRSTLLSSNNNVFDYKVRPGDAIVVPEKIIGNDTAWQHIAATAQMLTSIALVARVATGF